MAPRTLRSRDFSGETTIELFSKGVAGQTTRPSDFFASLANAPYFALTCRVEVKGADAEHLVGETWRSQMCLSRASADTGTPRAAPFVFAPSSRWMRPELKTLRPQ